jgi:hypothetical protein
MPPTAPPSIDTRRLPTPMWVVRRAVLGLLLMLVVTTIATLIAAVAVEDEPTERASELTIGQPATELTRR